MCVWGSGRFLKLRTAQEGSSKVNGKCQVPEVRASMSLRNGKKVSMSKWKRRGEKAGFHSTYSEKPLECESNGGTQGKCRWWKIETQYCFVT